MRNGKPGISSFDMFATAHAIRSELRTMGGNLLGLNSTIMKLANGDDDSRASLDGRIGSREAGKVSSRQIGKTVSSRQGGVGPKSTPARTANLLGNPYMRRYEGPDANGRYNFGLDGSPAIGEYYDVYESESNRLRFLDDTVGRDLLGYTHLENAAIERSGEAQDDKVYLRSTYGVFNDLEYPFDYQDIEVYKWGPKRYNPSAPYVLKPLEENLVRKTMNGHVQGFRDRFEAVVQDRELFHGPLLDYWDYMGSHYYLNLLNGVAEHGLYVENYDGEPRNRVMVHDRDAVPQSDYAYFLDVDTISPDKEIKGLLGKTNRMFYEGKIRSLANRFATLNGHNEGMPGFLNTATDHLYGLSRGRNLRKLDLTNENGYPNPYCRVWTTHYQYSKYKHLIRGKWADDSMNAGVSHYTLHNGDQLMRPNKGYDRLKKFTSLDPENGRPIITPYYVNDRNKMEEDSIKRCMFSIENLAWKDIVPDAVNANVRREDAKFNRDKSSISAEFEFDKRSTSTTVNTVNVRSGMATGFGMTLTEEQRGPNGGRIMWFPPYNLKFSEQARANWNDNQFIGRGEKIYTYINSERHGSLSFTLLIDHPSIINEWARGGKMGKTANKVDPLSKDEMILRYFAGCDAMEFNPREAYDVPYDLIDSRNVNVNEELKDRVVSPGKEAKTIQKEEENPDKDGMTFYSVFYYPNNYAAQDFNESQNYTAGIEEMFEKGLRDGGGIGYELGQGSGKTGMTYNGKGFPDGYYYRGPDKNGTVKSWYYPVDSRVKNETLGVRSNNVNRDKIKAYKDLNDYGLNGSRSNNPDASLYGTFWSGVPSEDKIVEYLNTGNVDISESDSNLKDAMSLLSMDAEQKKYLVPAYNFFRNLKQMVTVFNAATKNNYTYSIDIQGYASSDGYVASNKILAENRARVLEGWIRSLGCFDFSEGKDKISSNGNGQIVGTTVASESDFRPKAARAAKITFRIVPKETIITEVQELAEAEVVETRLVQNTKVETGYTEEFDTSKADDYENQTYDDEYTYFKQINENDDMVKRYISDKVDYFDPAFHSITPEGFNARLTFLQQCLRQGPTISASDTFGGGSYGAGNLSFGRAPFCVLRIGDFFNTKICIESINIEYDTGGGVQWDLNPEGVGLQPMMANVNMTFTFLGGSDLSGPISRLQNAVSYNYYANTSVYDRRADYRDNFISESDDTAMSWSPVIKDKDKQKNITEHFKFSSKIQERPKNKEGENS